MKKVMIAAAALLSSVAFVKAQNATESDKAVAAPTEVQQGEKVKIKSEELPEAVKKSLEAQEYRGWMISSAYKAGDIYEVELKNGAETKTVKFSKDGKKVD
jgi:ribosomal protein L21E